MEVRPKEDGTVSRTLFGYFQPDSIWEWTLLFWKWGRGGFVWEVRAVTAPHVRPSEVVLRPSADTCMCDILGFDNVTEIIKFSVSITKGSCELLRKSDGHEVKPLKRDHFFYKSEWVILNTAVAAGAPRWRCNCWFTLVFCLLYFCGMREGLKSTLWTWTKIACKCDRKLFSPLG